ncbi:hypothetical protein FOMPIDRAFT_88963 [Fomitopsis schrenkii]|uniref:Uncharacterized protein n=1 Tax=Fomitopsis schrenkii TaxID=2126942 RepID=S8ECM2_FOMSC|nr:hypothetical protein FOMPIDRAFT_88963 [Fomitopsis schrenkii]
MFDLPQLGSGTQRQNRDDLDYFPVVHVTDTAAEICSVLKILLVPRHMADAQIIFDDTVHCAQLAPNYARRTSPRHLSSGPCLLTQIISRLETPGTMNEVPSSRRISRASRTRSRCQIDDQTLYELPRFDTAADRLSTDNLARCTQGKAALCHSWPAFLSDIFDVKEQEKIV